MRFYCIDSATGNQIFHYLEREKDKICDSCLEIDHKAEKSYKCKKKRYYSSKLSADKKYMFCFCLKENLTKKQAKPIVTQTINAFLDSQKIASDISAIRLTNSDLAMHNTKNLHAEINNKLLSLFNEEQLSSSLDKIQFVEQEIIKSPRKFAREILSVIKSVSQVMHEYNIIDFVNPNTRLQRADFGYHKAHTLCVMCFYLYELEFKEKDIQVSIGNNFDEIFINWGTAKTAISQIFDNCLKYCSPHSTISIEFENTDNLLTLVFEMTSLYFSDEESAQLTLPKFRSSYANRFTEGKGAGMGIIQRMMELNEGVLKYESYESTKYYSGDIPYSNNNFSLSFRCK